jgi:hypothetical protein
MNRCLLDTDILSEIIKGKIVYGFRRMPAERFAGSGVSIAHSGEDADVA